MRQDYLRTLQNNPDFKDMVIEDGIGNLHFAGETKKSKFISNLKVNFSKILEKITSRRPMVIDAIEAIKSEYAYTRFDDEGAKVCYSEDYKIR